MPKVQIRYDEMIETLKKGGTYYFRRIPSLNEVMFSNNDRIELADKWFDECRNSREKKIGMVSIGFDTMDPHEKLLLVLLEELTLGMNPEHKGKEDG